MVESLLPKQVVVGSNPISRSNIEFQNLQVELNPQPKFSYTHEQVLESAVLPGFSLSLVEVFKI